ncbi:MAG: hypothetical protein LH474_02255 [Chamaesiphon sp.]|nr:hypothetical protein [Chamaesiphon sp.]
MTDDRFSFNWIKRVREIEASHDKSISSTSKYIVQSKEYTQIKTSVDRTSPKSAAISPNANFPEFENNGLEPSWDRSRTKGLLPVLLVACAASSLVKCLNFEPLAGFKVQDLNLLHVNDKLTALSK